MGKKKSTKAKSEIKEECGVKGYKVFDESWQCQNFQYQVGQTYEMPESEIEICQKGFHFCDRCVDCFNYKDFNPKNKVAEIIALGIIKTENDKSVTNKIKILKELSWEEMLKLCNQGIGNTGRNNSGHSNSGNRNSGDYNSGDYNSGHFNTITPDTILVFNKPCLRQNWDNAVKPNFFYNIDLTKWITKEQMSKQENLEHPEQKTLDGYLKTTPYKQAWQEAWQTATEEDKRSLKALPNFDAVIFEKITSIHVE